MPRNQPITDIDEARIVKTRVLTALESCDESDIPKLTDSYSRISNAIRQLEKQRRKDIESFTDDEVLAYLLGLPERRRKSFLEALSGEDVAGKPLFG